GMSEAINSVKNKPFFLSAQRRKKIKCFPFWTGKRERNQQQTKKIKKSRENQEEKKEYRTW
ncbi:MAG: hypothetical protein ACHQUA_01975, partial [Microgenomates group bacterium]